MPTSYVQATSETTFEQDALAQSQRQSAMALDGE